jgi:hypothetical protein
MYGDVQPWQMMSERPQFWRNSLISTILGGKCLNLNKK